MEPTDIHLSGTAAICQGTSSTLSPPDAITSPGIVRTESNATSREDEEDSSNAASSDCKSPGQRWVFSSPEIYLNQTQKKLKEIL